MKLFVFAAVLALANCSVLKRRGGRGRGDGSDSEEDDDMPRGPLMVAAYKQRMLGLVDKVYNIDKMIAAFGEEARNHTIENPSMDGFMSLAEDWEDTIPKVSDTMDDIAKSIVGLGFGLYMGGGDFIEHNFCDGYKNFVAEYDSENPEAYIQAMGETFLEDLGCFRGIIAHVEMLKEFVGTQGEEMSEDLAITLVTEFLKGLHLIRLNALRFVEAVEDAASVLFEEPETQPPPSVQQLLKIRALFEKAGLIH